MAIPSVFVVASVWLAVQAFGPDAWSDRLVEWGFGLGPWLAGAALIGSLVAALGSALATDPEARARRRRAALLAPCVIVPLAVISPWTAAPGGFGIGLGNLPFFIGWLTRYPTAGAVDHEVALGIGAVLGTCAVPSFFAAYASRAPRLGARAASVFVALQLIAYVPVFLRLDLELLAYASVVATSSPAGFFSSGEPAPALALYIAAGPLLHLAAASAMLASLAGALTSGRPRVVVWE